MSRFWLLLGTFALSVGIAGLLPVGAQPIVLGKKGAAKQPKPAVSILTDAETLKAAELTPTDGAKLVGYLKLRTLSDADIARMKEVIARFSSDDFELRLKAMQEIEKFGPAAVTPLRNAANDTTLDAEVAYRSGLALKKLEKVPHAEIAAAVVRTVVKLKPPEAAAALIGFFPLADTEVLGEEIRDALVELAVRDGKPDPALVAALSDSSPLRRGAAYVALTEGGPPGEFIRIKEAYPLVKEAVRKEADPDTKFRGLWSLLLTTREKEFVPELIAAIPQMPRGRVWQFEEFLLQIAGEFPAGGRFGKTPESLGKTRDAWAAWWAKKGGAVDLAKLDFKPRIHGYMDLVEMDTTGLGRGNRFRSVGPDMKERWRVAGLIYPTDARTLPNGRVMMVEQNYARVTVREVNNPEPIITRQVNNQPLSAEPVGDDGMLVICRGQVIEYDKEGKVVFSYARPNHDIIAGRRLPGGDTVFLTYINPGPNCVRLDAKGKEVGKGVSVGMLQNVYPLVGMDVIGEETLLIGQPNQVIEFDLKNNKAGWKYTFPAAAGQPQATPNAVQRLPNGNTLITSYNQNKVVEVDPDGTEVWDMTGRDGYRIIRAYRR